MQPNMRLFAQLTALGASSLLCWPIAASAQSDEPECIDLKGTPPGLYVTVDQSQVFLIKDDKIVELNPGETGYASESDVACLKVQPRLLEWPCGTAEALNRRKAPTYTVDELPAIDVVAEVERRYFEENQAIGPPIEWLNDEIHQTYPVAELIGLNTQGYWYLPGSDDPFASPKRPRSQLVSLFWSTKQTLLDPNTLERLEAMSGEDNIPVVFIYNEDNQVPVSFFGPDVTLQQVWEAFIQNGIELAPVPVWYVGDHHLKVSISEMESLFDIPTAEEIGPQRMAVLQGELEAFGFTHKPITVSFLAEGGSLMIDQPDRVRAAAEMGIEAIPIVVFYYTGNTHLAKCGLEMPQISVVAGMSGEQGSTPPPLTPPKLPDPERPVSDS